MGMKRVIVIGDGMADWPIPSLGNRTPLEAAHTPNLDYLASHGALGTVQVVPKDMYPGSDVSNLSILGYDPREVYTGRSPLEAASMGVNLGEDDVAVRCNLVTLSNHGGDLRMEDFSAGHIDTAEAAELLRSLQEAVGVGGISFHPGVGYRHLMVWPGGNDKVRTTAPHDIHGKAIADYLPTGQGAERLRALMEISREVFRDHPVNRSRAEQGKAAGNSVWLWGQGKAPRLQTFRDRYGLAGSVVAAVDLVRGIGVYAGLAVVDVPGATGYLDTNYGGKGAYALRELASKDFVLVHVEAPDEAGHNGDAQEKVRAIERIDEEIVGPILARARNERDLALLVLPDHPTPVAIRTHAQEPVPFVFFPAPRGLSSFPGSCYTEADARRTGQVLDSGTRLIGHLLSAAEA